MTSVHLVKEYIFCYRIFRVIKSLLLIIMVNDDSQLFV